MALLAPALYSSAAPAGSDYLTPELRQQVEQLKADVAADAPIKDVDALHARALVLYAWSNAFRSADPDANDLPWNLPSTIAGISRARYLRGDEPIRPPLRRGVITINDFVRQLALRDEDPQALGQVRLANPGPHPVDSYAAIDIIYTVGSQPIKQGARFALSTHRASGISAQLSNAADANYLSAASSRAGVQLRDAAAGDASGESDAESDLPANVTRADIAEFIVAGGDLQPGDTVTFRLGDQRGGGPGVRLQSFSNDFIPIELHMQFAANGTRYTLPRMGLQTMGGAVAGVHGFAPSVLPSNEPFTLSIRSEDKFTNRATGAIPGYRVLLNGKPYKQVKPGPAISQLQGLKLAEPGVYRFAIESTDGPAAQRIRGVSNPILVQAQPQQRVYWGETHGHSGMAEGQGTSKAFFAFGREDARLDFLVHSEHDIWLDDWEWEELRRNSIANHVPDEFIPFLGYEWTVEQTFGGHHNVLFRSPEGRARVPQQTHPTLSLLYQGLRTNNAARDVLIIPHAHQAGDWRFSDPSLENLVEIQSDHGVFEWFGHMYLQYGHHVGFVSASDDHRSHPGYGVARGRRSGLAAVMSPEKTRDGLFDAMKSLRTYATTGERIILNVDVNGAGMGQTAPFSTHRKLSGRVIGTSPIDVITVQKNSKEVWQQDLRTQTSPVSPDETVEVSFASDATPQDMLRDNPRGGRAWAGSIEVRGAQIAGVQTPSFVDVLTQQAVLDKDNPNLVRFRTWTRGNHSSLIVSLRGATPATEVIVRVAPTVERQGNFTRYRGTVNIPAFAADFKLADSLATPATRGQEVQGYTDRIELRRVTTNGVLDQSFSFEDKDEPKQGDYYTVRILQENDQLAWSSPIWVGGYPVRQD